MFNLVKTMSQPEFAQKTEYSDFEFLAEISRLLTLTGEAQVLELVINRTSDYIGAERSSLLLHPEHNAEWSPVFYTHVVAFDRTMERYEREQSLHFARRVLDRGLAGWVVEHRQAAIVADTQTDPRWVEFPDGKSQARSAMCIPFIFKDDVIGVLTFLHRTPGYFTQHHMQIAIVVANQATVAVRNAQLFGQMLANQQQLHGMLRAMPDLLMVLDGKSQLLLVNRMAGVLLDPDRALDAFAGEAFGQFVHDDPLLRHIGELVAQAAESEDEQVWSFEARSRRTMHDYMVTISRWANPVGLPGYIVVLRDVTQLRDLNRFKDEMLQMASHDLRSPLALIVGYCSLIELDTPLDSPIQEYLQIIQRSTERMKGLLDDLLRVEQIRTSPLEMHERVDFDQLVRQVIHNLTPSADTRRQRLFGEIALTDVPGVMLNPVLIRETMENLVNNAIKYTPEGGQIAVSAYRDGDRLHFEVQDNGIGIPKEAIPRLFQSFFRAKQPGTENIEGRGFGLSLVKTIIERHNGQVWVESEVGKGSRFGFWIPMVVSEDAA